MFYYDDFFEMMLFVIIALFILSLVRRMMASRRTTSTTTTSTKPKPQAVTKNQMAEDIKATKTSQISDAVAILDDLGSTTSGYRHYCELVGTSMASSGITAPYSRRPVAYYDIKCYRIDSTYGGGQEETLVAHEHSFDPFFFTDPSSDTPVYVDLESFGNNVILVNSTNHIEGPNSDFAKAFQSNATTASSSGTSSAYAMVAHGLGRATQALLGATNALRRSLTPHAPLQPAYALAGGGTLAPERDELPRNIMFADSKPGTHRGGGHPGSGQSRQPQVSIHVGYGPNNLPPHLGDFMGGYVGSPWVIGGSHGYGHMHRPTTDPADIIMGMSLGALLNSMNQTQQMATATTTSKDTFRGYRLVENVVPLSSPIYCIGEIYRHGTDVYMSRSLSKDYPTSYFATKPEAEVLSAIGAH